MSKFKVVILGLENDPLEQERSELAGLDAEIVQARPESDGEAMELVKEADAVMVMGNWGRKPIIDATTKCKIMAVYSHGFNNIDVEALVEKRIILTNSAGMCAEEVSDQAAAFILALNRSVVQTTEDVRKGVWDRHKYYPVVPLDQCKLSIIGFGNIARRLARKMSAWRMDIAVYDPYCPPWVAEEYGVPQLETLNEAFRFGDYVTVIVPLNDETHHFIGKEQFDQMKSSAYFVNVCRGQVVDEQALISALQSGKIRGAGLDVFEEEPASPDNPLLKMSNVICAPHIAGTSIRSEWLSRQRAAQQVASALRGEWPHAVQNPEVAALIEEDRKAAKTSAGKIAGAAAFK